MKLSTNHIKVGDLDTPRKDLLLWLVNPPKYGHIENTKRGETRVRPLFPHQWRTHVSRCYNCMCTKFHPQDCFSDSHVMVDSPQYCRHLSHLDYQCKLALQLQMDVLLLTYIEHPTSVCKEKA